MAPNNSAPFDDVNTSDDEGGLRAPPGLSGWRKAWWWFHFLILVKLARLRFIAILVVIGILITQWDTLAAYYDKWTRPADASEARSSDTEYFCPMHPTVIRDNPKEKCPICFMPLSKRKKGSAEAEPLPAGVVNRVQLSPYRVALAGVQTWTAGYVPLVREITTVGSIEFNERGQKTVSARVNGRIDKLYANETGQMVKAGDDLALIYSPDLLVTAQTMIDANKRGDQRFVESSRVRLQRLGIDDGQIDEILASGKADLHIKIRSPISGHVIRKYVREGEYVQEGMSLYDVADLATVWIQAQVYEDDMALLSSAVPGKASELNGDSIEVAATTRAHPNDVFRGNLSFIYPHVDQDTRTVVVRFEVQNQDHKLKPGSTASVTIKVPLKDVPGLDALAAKDDQASKMLAQGRVLAVPESAVIDTGSQKIVYREDSAGVFEGVTVELGPRMTGPGGATFYPVLGGVKQGDKVVASGSFLVDAETRLNPAAGSIYFGGSGGGKSGTTTVRPTTPEDQDAKVIAALAKLSEEDRRAAEAQKFCPVLEDSRLGGMGTPVKLIIEGQPVFLCCPNCKAKALKDPTATLERVAELKKANSSSPNQ